MYNQTMKMAIVCDDLIQWGGAEKVFLDVIKIYPGAVVFTSVISDKWKQKLQSLNVKYQISFLQKFPFVTKLYRFYSLFYLHVLAFESFDFSKFDTILSLSSRYAHFVITKPRTRHICYMHSPARMFWNTQDYFESEFWKKFLFLINPFLFFVRMNDYIAAQKVDVFIANSKVTQRRIKKYYKRDSVIINPCIDVNDFKVSAKISDYFLMIGRMLPWKKFDLVIKAVNKLNQNEKNNKFKLKIIGNGADYNRLISIAKKNKHIEFLGPLNDMDKATYLSSCKALIYPQCEDFGIVPLECMASGRPVIAYGKGGVLETVTTKTGIFFENQTIESLYDVLKKYDHFSLNPEDCILHARKFDKNDFKSKLVKLLNDV